MSCSSLRRSSSETRHPAMPPLAHDALQTLRGRDSRTRPFFCSLASDLSRTLHSSPKRALPASRGQFAPARSHLGPLCFSSMRPFSPCQPHFVLRLLVLSRLCSRIIYIWSLHQIKRKESVRKGRKRAQQGGPKAGHDTTRSSAGKLNLPSLHHHLPTDTIPSTLTTPPFASDVIR